jgi:DNA-binding MarR family transcriptional regulator
MSANERPGDERGPAALVQSVDRALAILEILAGRGEVGVTEIAAELGVHKSTAFRLIAVLESRDLVEQLADRGKYRLGFGVVRLAGATVAQLDLAKESRRTCEELAADLGETVNVAILDADRAVNVSQVRGTAGHRPLQLGRPGNPAARDVQRQGPARPRGRAGQGGRARGNPAALHRRHDHRPRPARRGAGRDPRARLGRHRGVSTRSGSTR